MPSKLGFGNSRTPMTKKASYGSAMHYKNPIKKDEVEKEKKITKTYNKDGSYTKSDGTRSTTYTPNPHYIKGSRSGGPNTYKYITGGKNADGSPIGE
jgi:hypothetical protein|tara:strand:+ start:266 stop:556 length:291 start_codon:yes stop_codon:yes gene_type:complete